MRYNMQVNNKTGILISFGELFLKSSGVKEMLCTRLARDIKQKLMLRDVQKYVLHKWYDRFFLVIENARDQALAKQALDCTFGISWFADANFLINSNIDDVCLYLEQECHKWIPVGATYCLDVRALAHGPYKRSMIIEKLAKFIDRKVNLSEPDYIIYLEMRKQGWLIFLQKTKGRGGLPTGCEGKVLALISGGIDSPIASWFTMKRGAENIWLHFTSFPLVSKISSEKTHDLANVLGAYQPNIKIIEVGFSEIQMQIKQCTDPKFRVLLYRRAMVRIAERIAQKQGAHALVTGESLGQVASQTLVNMSIVDKASSIPILRPLVGLDKEEIINIAKRIGTYDISIIPQEDCCSLFAPKKSTAHGNIDALEQMEMLLNLEPLLECAVNSRHYL
jgi:tRNA uracil 4-sulfurtransferase